MLRNLLFLSIWTYVVNRIDTNAVDLAIMQTKPPGTTAA
jgi:hypothetical protein